MVTIFLGRRFKVLMHFSPSGPLPLSETIRPPEDIQAFRSVVFRDLLESERAHVAELRGMMENFLEPLEGSQT